MSIILFTAITIFISIAVLIIKRKHLVNHDIPYTTENLLIKKKNFTSRKSLNPMLLENSTFFIVQKLDKNYVPNKILQYDLKNLTIFNVKGKMYEMS